MMKSLLNLSGAAFCISASVLAACSEGGDPETPMGGTDAAVAPSSAGSGSVGSGGVGSASSAIVYRSQITPITRVDQALPGTFIPPFEDCRDPVPGDSATRSDGKVCTNVAISGCTEEGKYFPSYAACDVVRRQRPYSAKPPANPSKSDDPRLKDSKFMAESAWAAAQIGASGCTCCHDSRVVPASQWDIGLGPLWIDSISDTGLALFAGLADSSVLGAYPAAQNHGFDRTSVGVPSTDPARMKAFALAELVRRGRSEQWAREVAPFGGPIYANSVKAPDACAAGQGVDPDGSVRWTGGNARYVYVLKAGSKNPGVPPNLDLPEGTLWRLDVLASAKALASGIRFGETPAGSFQTYPASTPAASLERGKTYQLVVLFDVGLPITNCLFQYGQSSASSAGSGAVDAGSSDAASVVATDAMAPANADAAAGGDAGAAMCTLPGGDARGFGATCNDTVNHSDCPCGANYCSKSPFDTQGYCSVTGCKENPSVCPAGWTCFDVSMFAPGQPSVCLRP